MNGEWVFRFPRRTIAAPLLEAEGRVLPALAPRLPFPIPRPEWFGHPGAGYPWPFLGYRRLAGQVASDAGLDDAARAALAQPLARFLRARHHSRRAPILRMRGPVIAVGLSHDAPELVVTVCSALVLNRL